MKKLLVGCGLLLTISFSTQAVMKHCDYAITPHSPYVTGALVIDEGDSFSIEIPDKGYTARSIPLRKLSTRKDTWYADTGTVMYTKKYFSDSKNTVYLVASESSSVTAVCKG